MTQACAEPKPVQWAGRRPRQSTGQCSRRCRPTLSRRLPPQWPALSACCSVPGKGVPQAHRLKGSPAWHTCGLASPCSLLRPQRLQNGLAHALGATCVRRSAAEGCHLWVGDRPCCQLGGLAAFRQLPEKRAAAAPQRPLWVLHPQGPACGREAVGVSWSLCGETEACTFSQHPLSTCLESPLSEPGFPTAGSAPLHLLLPRHPAPVWAPPASESAPHPPGRLGGQPPPLDPGGPGCGWGQGMRSEWPRLCASVASAAGGHLVMTHEVA